MGLREFHRFSCFCASRDFETFLIAISGGACPARLSMFDNRASGQFTPLQAHPAMRRRRRAAFGASLGRSPKIIAAGKTAIVSPSPPVTQNFGDAPDAACRQHRAEKPTRQVDAPSSEGGRGAIIDA